MRAYYYLAKMKLLVSLTYRFEVLTTLGTNLILIISSYYLWKTAYKGIDSVKGVNESQMITYSMISVLLNSIFNINFEQRLQDRIEKGDMVIDFIRPVNFLLCNLAEDIGETLSSALSKLLPLLLFIVTFIHSSLPLSPLAFVLFLISVIFSFIILWLLSAIIALLSFWILQLGHLSGIKDGIIFILSGRIIPLWLFPESLQKIINYLPFQYIYQTPLSIYIGKLQFKQALAAMVLQLVWIVLLGLIVCFEWSRAKKQVLIQGG